LINWHWSSFKKTNDFGHIAVERWLGGPTRTSQERHKVHRGIVVIVGSTVERTPAEHTVVERREIERARDPRPLVANRISHCVSIVAQFLVRCAFAPNEVEE
jgi:hypothetical protein